MRVRRDSVFISTFLFTVTLLLLMEPMWEDAMTWRRTHYEIAEGVWAQNVFAPVGFASLADIFIALIVLWTTYIKKVRWAWFVMLIVVWVWAFPVFILPDLQRWESMVPFMQWFPEALQHPGIERTHLKIYVIFLLMVIALILPMKSFFGNKRQEGST